MYDRATIAAALRMLASGMSRREVAGEIGASCDTVSRWGRGLLPSSWWERPPRPPRGSIVPGGRRRLEEAVTDEERAAYEAAMEENALLRAVLDDLKAAGSDPLSTSRRRRTELAGRLRLATGLPLRRILGFLGLSRSSYGYHRARPGGDRDAWPRPLVREAFAAEGNRGYRAVHARLRREGTRVSEKRVRRVMREEGLRVRSRRRRRYSSYAGENGASPPNLPLRSDGTHRFDAPAPNLLWVSDVTEFRLPSGERCYLSPVIDCFDGRPVAWSVGPRPTAGLANSSLEAACATLGEGERPVVHTDRGSHYRWPGWVALCGRFGLARSMSRKGTSPDNARAEGFFGTLKREFFHGRDWSGWSLGDFMAELDAWLRWFNSGRARQTLGWLTPDEYRASVGWPVG